MYDPAHPGEIVLKEYLEPLGISVTDAAKRFHMSRKALSQFLNGHSRLSPQMAMRLAQAFPNTDAWFWMGVQQQYDLAPARRLKVPRIKPFTAA